MKYQKEKERVDEIRRLKQKREELLFTLQEAERRMDLARVADLRYGALQEIEAAIARYETGMGENLMLTETVGPEQIAEVQKHLDFEYLQLPSIEYDWLMLKLINNHSYSG